MGVSFQVADRFIQVAPRERWIGWRPEQQWCRLHLIVNNTGFAMLEDAGGYPNLGSHVLKLICRRISDDWQAVYGHGVLLAETFVDPVRHGGTVYDALGWQTVDQSAGYSRRGGKYTEAHDQIKRLLVRPLRRDARRILCQRSFVASASQSA